MTPSRLRAALLVVILLTVLAGSAEPATAHADLTSAEPADGSSVHAMPRAVVLRFTEDIRAPAAVTVVGPSGREMTAGDPATLGPVLTQKLTPRTDGPGGYAVRFQVMSDDGHLVYGATTFTVSGGARFGAAGRLDDGGLGQSTVLLLGLALLATVGLAGAGIRRLAGEPTGG